MLFVYRNKQHQHEQELLKTQLEIQENTFQNISQEIHDNIGQVLSVIKLTLASAPVKKDEPAFEYLLNARAMVNTIIEDVSDLSKSLHSDRILRIGFEAAIRFELTRLEKTGIFATVFEHPEEPLRMKEKNEIFLFRIIQEVLNNIVKHSKAKNIRVAIRKSARNSFIEIGDDGRGFDVENIMQKNPAVRGIGLTSMINRTKLIGGVLTINSQPGKGTVILIRLPADI
jgi:signal transduction histidine kinase